MTQHPPHRAPTPHPPHAIPPIRHSQSPPSLRIPSPNARKLPEMAQPHHRQPQNPVPPNSKPPLPPPFSLPEDLHHAAASASTILPKTPSSARRFIHMHSFTQPSKRSHSFSFPSHSLPHEKLVLILQAKWWLTPRSREAPLPIPISGLIMQ